MRSLLLLLACGLASSVGPSFAAAVDSPAGAPPAGISETILSCVSSAARAESFLLAPELNFLHRDRPRFHSWFVVTRGSDLDSSGVRAVTSLLDSATPDRYPATSELCGFSPAYALRFHSQGAPLDMLISSNYARWCFLRDGTREGSYSADAGMVRDSLGVLIHRLFPNLGHSDEAK